jgi:hypothetical protein
MRTYRVLVAVTFQRHGRAPHQFTSARAPEIPALDATDAIKIAECQVSLLAHAHGAEPVAVTIQAAEAWSTPVPAAV